MVDMKEKKTGGHLAIEHLVKTITGNLAVKGIQEKRKKLEAQIEVALLKHAEMLFKKKMNHNKIKDELQTLANVILERSQLIDEFFKCKVVVSLDKTVLRSDQDDAKKTVKEHLSILDKHFKVQT